MTNTNRQRKIHHAILGSVDIHDGPAILEEEAVWIKESEASRPGEDVPVIDFPAPEVPPDPPKASEIARKFAITALRRLADKLDKR